MRLRWAAGLLAVILGGCGSTLDLQSLYPDESLSDVRTVEATYADGSKASKHGIGTDAGGNLVYDGAFATWYPGGKKHREGQFLGGKKSGLWKVWYSSGTLASESHYEDDEQHGSHVAWFENGKLEERGAYRGGDRDGPWETYREDGSKDEVGTYDKGVRVGLWTAWDKDGRKVSEIEYVQGRKLTEKLFF